MTVDKTAVVWGMGPMIAAWWSDKIARHAMNAVQCTHVAYDTSLPGVSTGLAREQLLQLRMHTHISNFSCTNHLHAIIKNEVAAGLRQ